MPIVEVSHDADVPATILDDLARILPHAVSLAVECPEEPYDHDLRPGDVELRFRARGPRDVGGLTVTVEVRSRWFESRARDRQERCDALARTLAATTGTTVGVFLSLPVAGWGEAP